MNKFLNNELCLRFKIFIFCVFLFIRCFFSIFTGRYSIRVYPTFLQLHGKTYDYKIPHTTVLRLFLLPHQDNRFMFFVVILFFNFFFFFTFLNPDLNLLGRIRNTLTIFLSLYIWNQKLVVSIYFFFFFFFWLLLNFKLLHEFV